MKSLNLNQISKINVPATTLSERNASILADDFFEFGAEDSNLEFVRNIPEFFAISSKTKTPIRIDVV